MNDLFLKILQTSLAGRYARALFDISLTSKESEKILNCLMAFEKILKENPNFSKMIQLMSKKQWEKFLNELADFYSWPSYFEQYLVLLFQEKRLSLFSQILAIFQMKVEKEKDVLPLTVITSQTLDLEGKKNIEENLKKIFMKKINFSYQIDKSLLGGIIIQLYNQQIDASLKHHIHCLEYLFKGAASCK